MKYKQIATFSYMIVCCATMYCRKKEDCVETKNQAITIRYINKATGMNQTVIGRTDEARDSNYYARSIKWRDKRKEKDSL